MDSNVLELKLNQATQEAINRAASIEEIRAAAVAEAERQQADSVTAAAAKTAADQKTAADEAAKVYSKSETINGREFVFEASTEEDLQQQIINAYRVVEAIAEKQAVVAAPQAQVEKIAQKTPAELEAEQAELKLKFTRGEISAKDYIRQSGAMDEYLAEQGLSVAALKGAVETNEQNQYVGSWQSATEDFRNSIAEWPASERNTQLMGMKIVELGLDDADDKVAALHAVYNALKEGNLLFPADKVNDSTTANTTVAVTTAAPTVAAPAPGSTNRPTQQQQQPIAQQTRTTSGLFGMSTGVSANNNDGKTDQKSTPVDIPATASPAEIMEAWKTSLAQQKIDPNAAFVETFGRR